MRRSLIVLLVVLGSAAAFATTYLKAPLNREEVEALLAASDLDTLDKAYESFGPTDIATQIVYATRRFQLEPNDRNELMLIGTIPDSILQYSLFYGLTNPDIFGRDYEEELTDVFYGYFERVARSVARHRTGVHAFLRLVALTDGEVKVVSLEWYSWLADRRPRLVREALSAFTADTQRLLCGDECETFLQGTND